MRPWIIFGVAAIVAVLFAHPICGLLFRCGCTFMSDAGCNVHHAGGPHCPWCVVPAIFFGAGASWLFGAALALRFARKRTVVAQIAAALIGFSAGVFASGAITVLMTDYPYFLVFGAP